MRRELTAVIVFCGVGTACERKVVTPSNPDVRVAAEPIALGTPLRLATSWQGWCGFTALEYAAFGGRWGPGDEEPSTPCNKVDYDVSVACDDDACTSRADGVGYVVVTATKPGLLRAHVTFTPHDGRGARTIALQPVAVVVPESATARCELWANGTAQVDVALHAHGSVLEHNANVRVRGAKECIRNAHDFADKRRAFTCPIDATETTLEAYLPGIYGVATTAACSLVYPVPSLGIPRPGSPHVFDLLDPYMSCTDDLMRETREGFAAWGWIEETRPEPGQARFVASRTGAKVEVHLTEGMNDEGRRICTWTLTTDATAIRGTHEIAD